jgi:hypothetical protein
VAETSRTRTRTTRGRELTVGAGDLALGVVAGTCSETVVRVGAGESGLRKKKGKGQPRRRWSQGRVNDQYLQHRSC